MVTETREMMMMENVAVNKSGMTTMVKVKVVSKMVIIGGKVPENAF